MYIFKFLFCEHNGKIAIFSHEKKEAKVTYLFAQTTEQNLLEPLNV